jgi:hypothetical protein
MVHGSWLLYTWIDERKPLNINAKILIKIKTAISLNLSLLISEITNLIGEITR